MVQTVLVDVDIVGLRSNRWALLLTCLKSRFFPPSGVVASLRQIRNVVCLQRTPFQRIRPRTHKVCFTVWLQSACASLKLTHPWALPKRRRFCVDRVVVVRLHDFPDPNADHSAVYRVSSAHSSVLCTSNSKCALVCPAYHMLPGRLHATACLAFIPAKDAAAWKITARKVYIGCKTALLPHSTSIAVPTRDPAETHLCKACSSCGYAPLSFLQEVPQAPSAILRERHAPTLLS